MYGTADNHPCGCHRHDGSWCCPDCYPYNDTPGERIGSSIDGARMVSERIAAQAAKEAS